MKNIFYFSIVFSTLFFIISGCDQKKGPEKIRIQSQPEAVKVGYVDSTKEGSEHRYIGYVESIDKVKIQPRVAGYLTQVLYKDGTYVTKDSPLATIENTTYKAKVNIAQATLQQAKSELAYAQSNYDRVVSLYKKEAIAKSSFDDAQRLLFLDSAKVSEAQARLADAENDLSYTVIYAPLSGHVGRSTYSVGNYVTAASAPLAEIILLDPIYVRFAIPERDYQTYLDKLLKAKDSMEDHINCKIYLSNGQSYSAPWKLEFTDNKIETGTILLWLKFKNPQYLLTAGGYVTIVLTERYATPMPRVPIQAVLRDDMGEFIYTPGEVDSTGITQVIRKNIKIIDTTPTHVIISEGIHIGDEIIVDGIHKIIHGVPVRLIK